MPKFLNEDFGIQRIPIYERVNLQFQANFFQCFKRVVFGAGGAPSSSTTSLRRTLARPAYRAPTLRLV